MLYHQDSQQTNSWLLYTDNEDSDFNPKVLIFFLFLNENMTVVTQKRLAEVLLMSTHNICFHGEIRKIFTGYPPLSRPMFKNHTL